MPTLIERLADHLQSEVGHEAGTARELAANTVRKWFVTGRDHNGREIAEAVLARARAEVVAFERERNEQLGEAAALGAARARPGGRTMRPRDRKALAEKLRHRASIAEGLLLALGAAGRTERVLDSAAALLGGVPNGNLREALEDEATDAARLVEALGYGRTPLRGDKGRFHGMHGREKASKTGALLPGPGAERCEGCGAPKASKDSSCARCGHLPVAEAATKDKPSAAEKAAAVAPASAPEKPAAAEGEKLAGKFGGGAAAAPEAPGAKGRSGEEMKDQAFEREHPRSAKGRKGGGRWISKGAGTPQAGGPSQVVRHLQVRLAALGYATVADGQFGDHTEEQVKAFQRDAGLSESGELDPRTVETLRNPPRRPDGSVGAAGQEATGAGGTQGAAEQPAGEPSKLPDPSDPEAIKAWQREHGLPESGLVDRATQAAMRAVRSATGRAGAGGAAGGDGMIRRGDGAKQPDSKVEDLQGKLSQAGFDTGADDDGVFSEGTDEAVRAFQRKYGLRVDGVAGSQTLETLERVLASRKGDQGAKLREASYVGINTTGGTFGTAVPYGGAVPTILADGLWNAMRAGTDAVRIPLNVNPDLTQEAKMEIRLQELREAREAAERAGDTRAWSRARARELAAMERLQEVSSKAYPSLERSERENWVEKAGGLPSYIERIAKHLHYEKGMTIGHAIATAVNAVKKMCAGGDLNFPGKQSVNVKSRAEACNAVRQWEAKKARHAAEQDPEPDPAVALVEALPASERHHPTFEQAFNIARDMEGVERRAGLSYLDCEEAVLTAARRKKLPSSAFAIPPDRYPIHDEAHARNALARVSQHGTPEEKKKVRAAVKRRYPKMVQEAAVAPDDDELERLVKKFMENGMPRAAAEKAAKKALAAKKVAEAESWDEAEVAEAVLSTAARKKLSKSDFVFPEKAPGSGSYPIHDRRHGANALARSSGKPEHAQVKAKVCSRYPDLPECEED